MKEVKPAAEQCSNCKAYLAVDQRYCLVCGARCGDPRLPFMDAVTFMDAMKVTPDAAVAAAPKPTPRRMSPNTALFATIGVLLLAMGVGVLIGRSGNHSIASAPVAAPQVIKVGGEEETKTASTKAGGGTIGSSAKKEAPKALKKQADSQAGANEVLHTNPNVKLPPAKVEVGGKCPQGTAGCNGGEFTGEFFGE